MNSPAFELCSPLRLTLTVAGDGAAPVVVDALEANDAIGAAAERAKDIKEPTAWLVELRPYLAKILGVPEEALALNQVHEFSEVISAMVTADTAARKKKLSTIASWQPLTPAYPQTFEHGTETKSEHGRGTLQSAERGLLESMQT